jgi:hypothetical protein
MMQCLCDIKHILTLSPFTEIFFYFTPNFLPEPNITMVKNAMSETSTPYTPASPLPLLLEMRRSRWQRT